MKKLMKIEVNCPTHDGWEPAQSSTEIEAVLLQNLALREKIHDDLGKIAEDAEHPQLQVLLTAKCNTKHAHGHDCDKHELGHHHEVIKIAGSKHYLCDPASLKTLLIDLRSALNSCTDSHDHSVINGLLNSVEKNIEELEKVSGCTHAMCLSCLNETPVVASKNVVTAADF